MSRRALCSCAECAGSGITPAQIDHFEAEELRMVAALLERNGQTDRASDARFNALLLDPALGTA